MCVVDATTKKNMDANTHVEKSKEFSQFLLNIREMAPEFLFLVLEENHMRSS